MMAAAQLAVLIGASPLPGINEIHIWKDDKGKIHVSTGVNYHRRRSVEIGGGVRWVPGNRPRPMTLAEKALYGIHEAVPAAICEGCRADEFDRHYSNGLKRLDDIFGICAQVGIGTAQPGERSKKGRPLIWSALKRAEADLLRQLYPNMEQPESGLQVARQAIDTMEGISMEPSSEEQLHAIGEALADHGLIDPADAGPQWDADTFDANQVDPGVMDGEFSEAQEEPPQEVSAGEELCIDIRRRASEYRDMYLRRGDKDKADGPASPKQARLIASMLTEAFAPDEDASKQYRSFLRQLAGVTSAKELTFSMARGILDEILSGKDQDTGAYLLVKGTEAKMRQVIREVMAEAGQMDMSGGLGEEE